MCVVVDDSETVWKHPETQATCFLVSGDVPVTEVCWFCRSARGKREECGNVNTGRAATSGAVGGTDPCAPG